MDTLTNAQNINTAEYWDNRFRSKDWNRLGRQQTREYAKANLEMFSLGPDFAGHIVEFGCALGDSIPVLIGKYPNSKITGIDISESAIETCKKRFGKYAGFIPGDHHVVPVADVIIASHVMEHITDDRIVVIELLSKCRDLYIIVPFREDPLYKEHVNYYDTDYYDTFDVVDIKPFLVSYMMILPLREIVRNLLKFKLNIRFQFQKEVVLYHIRGNIK
jgi:hypothetical protein